MNRPEGAIENLKAHQEQLDADGIMVGVSRQALEEALEYVGKLHAVLTKAEGKLRYLEAQARNETLAHHVTTTNIREVLPELQKALRNTD